MTHVDARGLAIDVSYAIMQLSNHSDIRRALDALHRVMEGLNKELSLNSPFDDVWDLCANEGWADDRGGAEYRRVRGEWDSATPNEILIRFIRIGCNVGPGGYDPPQSNTGGTNSGP